MKKHLLRNVFWIALIAVWSFLAGAYFHLGWVRNRSVDFQTGFVIGGIAIWIVFFGIGFFIYRFVKKNGNEDPVKPALAVVSFFTICFLLIAWIKYDDVKKDKFIEDMEYSFVLHYTDKAMMKGIKFDDMDWELKDMYSSIQHDLRRHSQLEKMMQLKTADAMFEDNTVITELCLDAIKLRQEIGYPPPAGMKELFE